MNYPQPNTANLQTESMALGQRLTALTIGMDQFERRRSGGDGALDSEGLVPIYLGGELVAPLSLQSWDEAREELSRLDVAARDQPEGPRRSFLLAMITSLQTAADLFEGQKLDYGEKLVRLVGVPNEPAAEASIEGFRSELDSSLGRSGYTSSTLADRVKRWERDRFIPADRLLETFGELMQEAKRRTDESIYDTGDYTMMLHPVSNVPYTARCNFAEGQMDLNTELEFSRSSLKHLVCHEVFPGHSTQLLYTLEAAKRGESPLDVLLCTTNGATGAVQEGIGDQGVHLIDWLEDEDDAIHMNLRRLRSAGQTTAAWQLMAGDWGEQQFRDYLGQTIFGQPAWIEGRLRFAKHPFRGPFIASYWFGDEAVREVREAVADDQRKAFITFLYGSMNTPASLRMFGQA